MPPHDAAAAAALEAPVRHPAWFGFVDLEDLPIRLTSAGYAVAFTGTGDPDLDGFTFQALSAGIIEVGEISMGEAGAEQLTIRLSGLPTIDADTLALLEDASKWRGRALRLWKWERDADGEWQGAIVALPLFWLSQPEIVPSASGGEIRLRVEGYLAAMTAEPSNRTYLSLANYDPNDKSAAASIGAANGASAGPGGTMAAVIAGGGGFAGAAYRALQDKI